MNVPARPQSSEPITHRIVERIASHEDADVTDLEPLHSAVDTDALDALFSPTSSGPRSGHVTFEYAGHTIVVDADGDVSVDARDGPSASGL